MGSGQFRPKMKVCIHRHGSMEMHFVLKKLVWLELECLRATEGVLLLLPLAACIATLQEGGL